MDRNTRRKLKKLGIPSSTQAAVTITHVLERKDGPWYVVLDFTERLKRTHFKRIIRLLKSNGGEWISADNNLEFWILPLYSWVDVDKAIARILNDPASFEEQFADDLRHRIETLHSDECAACGMRAEETEHGLHAHHIVPLQCGGDDDDKNLIVLCTRCHARLHALYRTTALTREFERNPRFFNEMLLNFLKRFDVLQDTEVPPLA